MKRLCLTGIALLVWGAAGCNPATVPGGGSGDGGGSGGSGGSSTADGSSTRQIAFALSEQTQTFRIQNGQPQANSEAFDFDVLGGPYDQISIDLEMTMALAEVVLDNPSAKTAATQQANSVAMVTFRIDDLNQQDSVCVTGEQYGPYQVTLDSTGDPIDVDQSPIVLSSSAVSRLNTGQFSICIEIDSPLDGTATIESLVVDLRTPPTIESDTSSCNPACGFQDGGPEGRAAAAICGITFSATSGAESQSPLNFADCGNDGNCDDGNDCTAGFCQGSRSPGGFFGFCAQLAVPDCFSDQELPQIFNGDMMFIEYDHSIDAATVNGTATQDEGTTWIANGLSPGRQTLLIEWQNRAGSNPATGCHRVDVFVAGNGTDSGIGGDVSDNFCDLVECPDGTICNPATLTCD